MQLIIGTTMLAMSFQAEELMNNVSALRSLHTRLPH